MTTTIELFNQVEELVGTWASSAAVNSALVAIIQQDSPETMPDGLAANFCQMMTRTYGTERGIHMHIGGTGAARADDGRYHADGCTAECNNPAVNNAGDPSLIARKGNCDPYVNFDHSDCTGDECKFDEGAYL